MHVDIENKPKNRATIELVSDNEIVISRTFNAPADLVFEAITTPEHVRVWYSHCEVMTMETCEIDLRVGGRWRHVLRMPDGAEHGFHGEYREIVRPSRLVSTENYEPIGPGHEVLATISLEEKQGRTLFKNRLRYQSKADRDGHLQSGMEKGLQAALDRLDALVSQAARAAS